MKSRPILFSAAMVRALLAGTKTQTRRAFRPQPKTKNITMHHTTIRKDGSWEFTARDRRGLASFVFPIGDHSLRAEIACPYGAPGDRLWVREGVTLIGRGGQPGGDYAVYTADWSTTPIDTWPWKRNFLPGIHMPRGACRIELEIDGIRAERLQDISEDDAVAEGVCERHSQDGIEQSAREVYRDLWKSINGDASWDENPWVWVVSFKRPIVDRDPDDTEYTDRLGGALPLQG